MRQLIMDYLGGRSRFTWALRSTAEGSCQRPGGRDEADRVREPKCEKYLACHFGLWGNNEPGNAGSLWKLRMTSSWQPARKRIPLLQLCWGNSLAVQSFGLHTSTAGGTGSIPVWGTKILQASWHGQKKNKNKNKLCWNWILPATRVSVDASRRECYPAHTLTLALWNLTLRTSHTFWVSTLFPNVWRLHLDLQLLWFVLLWYFPINFTHIPCSYNKSLFYILEVCAYSFSFFCSANIY